MRALWFLGLIAAAASLAEPRRVLLDAHNCYPYDGKYADRIERALATGLPVAIEQDLAWHVDPVTGKGKSVLSHETKTTGDEPLMRDYFFERLRPLVEKELKSGDKSRWPLVVLNLDFKTNEEAHHRAVWDLLTEYREWLTSAPRKGQKPEKLDVKPILVLTGNSDEQERVFHDAVPPRGRLLVFGAIANPKGVTEASSPKAIAPHRATNYRRWWNNPWMVVERGGPRNAAGWTAEDQQRLRALVKHAHKSGLWIRFYTLNGHDPAVGEKEGWSAGYNFGAAEGVARRWQACLEEGVDFVATDQYEAFDSFRKNPPAKR